jgi:hypothetical protein
MTYDIYVPKHFLPSELVPPGYTDSWFYLLDPQVLLVADLLRDMFGSIVINNYSWGGGVQFAGWRPFDCKTGSKYSQHKWGRALDLKFKDDVDLEDVVSFIVKCCPTIRIIRVYSWGIHIDTRNVKGKDPTIWRSA